MSTLSDLALKALEDQPRSPIGAIAARVAELKSLEGPYRRTHVSIPSLHTALARLAENGIVWKIPDGGPRGGYVYSLVTEVGRPSVWDRLIAESD